MFFEKDIVISYKRNEIDSIIIRGNSEIALLPANYNQNKNIEEQLIKVPKHDVNSFIHSIPNVENSNKKNRIYKLINEDAFWDVKQYNDGTYKVSSYLKIKGGGWGWLTIVGNAVMGAVAGFIQGGPPGAVVGAIALGGTSEAIRGYQRLSDALIAKRGKTQGKKSQQQRKKRKMPTNALLMPLEKNRNKRH